MAESQFPGATKINTVCPALTWNKSSFSLSDMFTAQEAHDVLCGSSEKQGEASMLTSVNETNVN